MSFFFFFNDTATTEIYTLSLHDALPISAYGWDGGFGPFLVGILVWAIGLSLGGPTGYAINPARDLRSEEHTSELQSRLHLVCRLLLEKKKKHQGASRSTSPTTRNILTTN